MAVSLLWRLLVIVLGALLGASVVEMHEFALNCINWGAWLDLYLFLMRKGRRLPPRDVVWVDKSRLGKGLGLRRLGNQRWQLEVHLLLQRRS